MRDRSRKKEEEEDWDREGPSGTNGLQNGVLRPDEDEEAEPKLVAQILQGIAMLKKEKTRPTMDKLVSKMKSMFGMERNTARTQLELAVQDQLIFKLNGTGGVSYSDPSAMKEHRNRNVVVKNTGDLVKVLVRIVREWVGVDGDGKSLAELDSFLTRTFNIEYDAGLDKKLLLKEAAKKAISSGYLSCESSKLYRLGPRALKDLKNGTQSPDPDESSSPNAPKTLETTTSKKKGVSKDMSNGSRPSCGICKTKLNKNGQKEPFLKCSSCGHAGHPSCLRYSPELARKLLSLPQWSCLQCKSCSICDNVGSRDDLYVCDDCDKVFHEQCLGPTPTLKDNNRWICEQCQEMADNISTKSVTKNAAAHVKKRYQKAKNSPAIRLPPSNCVVDGMTNGFEGREGGKPEEVKSLFDSLSHFFTPTGDRRSRIPTSERRYSPSGSALDSSRCKEEQESKHSDSDEEDAERNATPESPRKRQSQVDTLFDSLSAYYSVNGSNRQRRKILPGSFQSCLSSSAKKLEEDAAPLKEEEPMSEENESGDDAESTKEASVQGGESLGLEEEEEEEAEAKEEPSVKRERRQVRPYNPKSPPKFRKSSISQLTRANTERNKGTGQRRVRVEPRLHRPKSLALSSDYSEGEELLGSILGRDYKKNMKRTKSYPVEELPRVNDEDRSLFQEIQQTAMENISQTLLDPVDNRCPGVIQFGELEMETWYSAPYPQEYARLPKLYICEFCLKYMKSADIMKRHCGKCKLKHPPAAEIYRKGEVAVFEVDGKSSKIYCQNLCLLAKLFLDHKTLYYDVEPFLFYVLTRNDAQGCHLVGYFSKEKYSIQRYNLSCIVTLPCYQQQGFGRFLIDFSFLLSRKENLPGTPERPLSDLGKLSYRSYWRGAILEYFHNVKSTNASKKINVKSISKATGMSPHDVVDTLMALKMLQRKEGRFVLIIQSDLVEGHWNKATSDKRRIWLDPKALKWTPLIQSPTKEMDGHMSPVSSPPLGARSPMIMASPNGSLKSPVAAAAARDLFKSKMRKERQMRRKESDNSLVEANLEAPTTTAADHTLSRRRRRESPVDSEKRRSKRKKSSVTYRESTDSENERNKLDESLRREEEEEEEDNEFEPELEATCSKRKPSPHSDSDESEGGAENASTTNRGRQSRKRRPRARNTRSDSTSNSNSKSDTSKKAAQKPESLDAGEKTTTGDVRIEEDRESEGFVDDPMPESPISMARSPSPCGASDEEDEHEKSPILPTPSLSVPEEDESPPSLQPASVSEQENLMGASEEAVPPRLSPMYNMETENVEFEALDKPPVLEVVKNNDPAIKIPSAKELRRAKDDTNPLVNLGGEESDSEPETHNLDLEKPPRAPRPHNDHVQDEYEVPQDPHVIEHRNHARHQHPPQLPPQVPNSMESPPVVSPAKQPSLTSPGNNVLNRSFDSFDGGPGSEPISSVPPPTLPSCMESPPQSAGSVHRHSVEQQALPNFPSPCALSTSGTQQAYCNGATTSSPVQITTPIVPTAFSSPPSSSERRRSGSSLPSSAGSSSSSQKLTHIPPPASTLQQQQQAFPQQQQQSHSRSSSSSHRKSQQQQQAQESFQHRSAHPPPTMPYFAGEDPLGKFSPYAMASQPIPQQVMGGNNGQFGMYSHGYASPYAGKPNQVPPPPGGMPPAFPNYYMGTQYLSPFPPNPAGMMGHSGNFPNGPIPPHPNYPPPTPNNGYVPYGNPYLGSHYGNYATSPYPSFMR